jgi:hypothetical protein
MLCVPLASCGGSSGGHQLSGTVVANLDTVYMMDLTFSSFHGTCRLRGFQCFARLVGKPCPKETKLEQGGPQPGDAVTVYDAKHRVVAVTHLTLGNYTDQQYASCLLTFATKIAGNSDSYSIATDNLSNESQYSRFDLDRAGWRVALKS